jgi:hypothetical protein
MLCTSQVVITRPANMSMMSAKQANRFIPYNPKT